jgi:hypothetical protein
MPTFAEYFEKWPKQATAQLLTKSLVILPATPPVRQFVQVNILPAPDKTASLPQPPDNMVKDARDNPA